MVVSRAKPLTPQQQAPRYQLKPEEVYHPGRVVRWAGRIYRVEWCDGEKVSITAGQSPYQSYYEYLPGVFEWNKYVVPVTDIFLQPL